MTEKIYAVRNYCSELVFRHFRRAAGAIVIIAFLVTSSLMLSGGCGDDGPGSCRRQQIRLACPAVSYASESCIAYIFDIVDDSVEPPVFVDEFTVNFKRKCESIDCFTLQCLDITTDSGTLVPVAEIIIETVDGQPVGGNEIVDRGSPGGRIIIDGEDFLLEPTGIVVP
jgi:hypothetical protein